MSCLRINPLPAVDRPPPCKFCVEPKRTATALLSVGMVGSAFHRRWPICAACLEAWDLELDRWRSVA